MLALDVRLVVLDSVVLLRLVLLALERLHLHSRILLSCEQLRELEARDGDFAVALGASDAGGPMHAEACLWVVGQHAQRVRQTGSRKLGRLRWRPLPMAMLHKIARRTF